MAKQSFGEARDSKYVWSEICPIYQTRLRFVIRVICLLIGYRSCLINGLLTLSLTAHELTRGEDDRIGYSWTQISLHSLFYRIAYGVQQHANFIFENLKNKLFLKNTWRANSVRIGILCLFVCLFETGERGFALFIAILTGKKR